MEKTVYLSGPITGLTFAESVEWTDYAIEEFEKACNGTPHMIWGYKPLRGKESLQEHGVIDAVVNTQNRNTTNKAIYGRDFNDVITCDAMLVNVLGAKSKSIGTCFEMAWASFLRKPLVLVMENEGNCHEHAFVQEALTHRTNNLDEGIRLVKGILLPK